MAKPYVIAIDGPAGSGKSSTAAGVAQALNIIHLDTGAMYRTITLLAIEKNIPVNDTTRLDALSKKVVFDFKRLPNGTQQVSADKRDVTRDIRSEAVTRAVSDYCTVAEIRKHMVSKQREAARHTAIVLEGRDIGTVVFPKAEFKFFLTAAVKERARCRQAELAAAGQTADFEAIAKAIAERDRKDCSRKQSPLRQAPDAVIIDTTRISLNQQIEIIVRCVRNKRRGQST